jgi:hypothetical protein
MDAIPDPASSAKANRPEEESPSAAVRLPLPSSCPCRSCAPGYDGCRGAPQGIVGRPRILVRGCSAPVSLKGGGEFARKRRGSCPGAKAGVAARFEGLAVSQKVRSCRWGQGR